MPVRADLLLRDPVLGLAEAAEYLAMHPVELRRIVREREITCVRRGDLGHIKIRLSELNRYLERHTIPARKLAVGE